MADKAISELLAASQVTPTDLFVLEQSGTAKKLTGHTLEMWLLSMADGHGGIQSIAKAGTSGLVDTYRITMADTTTFDFLVTNGKGINSIAKTKTSGLVDTYTISYNDNTSGTFTVTNGAKGDKGDNQYVWIKYASQKPTASSHSFGDIPDAWVGFYSGASSTAPTDWQQYNWYQIKGEKGDTGAAATVSSNVVEYQVSDSGTIIPSGSWGTNVPVVAQGRYLWTRTTTTFNSGSPAVSYSVSRMGLDGSGSVSAVAHISPDENGNVPLTASDVGALPSTGGDMTGELKMNGQPISGLNAPTANDQVANMGFVNQQVKKAAPRNLLDNSYFRNPVNQRGQQSYTRYGYCIDRWRANGYGGNGTIAINTGYITLTPTSGNYVEISQILDNADKLTGKAMTLAVKTAEYGTSIYNFTFGTDWQAVDGEITLIHFGGNAVIIRATTINLEWTALYEGEYTAETLPEYQTPDFQEEFDKCQRYLFPLGGKFSGGDFSLSGFVSSTGTSAEFVIPKRMRYIDSGANIGSVENLDYSKLSIGVPGKTDWFYPVDASYRVDGNGYPVLRLSFESQLPIRCPAIMICTDGNIRYSQDL